MTNTAKEVFFQVIITGKPLSEEQAKQIRMFVENNKTSFFVGSLSWCQPNGSIGYIDHCSVPNMSKRILEQMLKSMGIEFPFLELGVTLMDGPPGAYNNPSVSFLLKEGKVTLTDGCHWLHPAPKRFKQ